MMKLISMECSHLSFLLHFIKVCEIACRFLGIIVTFCRIVCPLRLTGDAAHVFRRRKITAA